MTANSPTEVKTIVPGKGMQTFRIPNNRCGSSWMRELPPGVMFTQSLDLNIRAPGGKETFYCDLGCTLTIVGKDNRGEIRAVSYIPHTLPGGHYSWEASHEIDADAAKELFKIAIAQNSSSTEINRLRLPKARGKH